MTRFVKRGDDMVRIVNRDAGIRLDQICRDLARALRGKLHGTRLIDVTVEAHNDTLEVQDEVRDILHDPRHRRELVLNALDGDARDCGTLDAAEQDTPKAVANRGTKAAFKRFNTTKRPNVSVLEPRSRSTRAGSSNPLQRICMSFDPIRWASFSEGNLPGIPAEPCHRGRRLAICIRSGTGNVPVNIRYQSDAALFP